MTPDQIEMLRPGMEVSVFTLDFETKPPYRIDAELRTEVVTGITKGKGSIRVHTKRPKLDAETGVPVVGADGAPEYLAEPGVYPADKVFATLESAAKACLDCIEGLASKITQIRKGFRDRVKAERLALRGAAGAAEAKPEGEDAAKPRAKRPGRPRKPRPEDPAPQAELPLEAARGESGESADILRPAAAEDGNGATHADPPLVNALA